MKNCEIKNLIPTIVFAFCSLNALCQIPNGGFEYWENILNYEKPVLWQTNQDSNIVRFVKDTIRTEGAYSLKIVPSAATAWLDCRSIATTSAKLVAPVGDNQSLYFQVRSVPDNQFGGTYLEILGKFYAGGTFISNYEWKNFEEIEDFTAVELPIPSPDVDSLTISISGGAINGAADGCSNMSFSWVDGFEISSSTLLNIPETLDESSVLFFPNPVRSKLYFEGHPNKIWKKIEIFNPSGVIVKQFLNETNSYIDLSSLREGIYFIRFLSSDGYVIKKIIKIK